MRGRTNVGGSGNLEINGNVELFAVAEGNDVVAGDFVELTGENASTNQIKSISNSACGVAQIFDNMLALFSYVPKSTNLSANVVKMGKIIKTYNFILDYSINASSNHTTFYTHVEGNKIYISYLASYANIYGQIEGEAYGKEDIQLIRYVTEIEFDVDGNLTKVKDYTVDFSGLMDYISKNITDLSSHYYSGGKFIFHNGYAYCNIMISPSSAYLITAKYYLLTQFDIQTDKIVFKSVLAKYDNNSSYLIDFKLDNNKILFSSARDYDSEDTNIKINMHIFDLESNTEKMLSWTGNNRSGKPKMIWNGNFIYFVYKQGEHFHPVVFQINSDLSISYLREQNEPVGSLMGSRNIFDSNYFKSQNGNDYLICYIGGIYGYIATVIKYEPISNDFSFFNFAHTDRNAMMTFVYSNLLHFAIALSEGNSNTVVYLNNAEVNNYTLKTSNFIYQDEEIIFAEALNIVKKYQSRINGVAKTSGSSRNKIQVYVPKTQ